MWDNTNVGSGISQTPKAARGRKLLGHGVGTISSATPGRGGLPPAIPAEMPARAPPKIRRRRAQGQGAPPFAPSPTRPSVGPPSQHAHWQPSGWYPAVLGSWLPGGPGPGGSLSGRGRSRDSESKESRVHWQVGLFEGHSSANHKRRKRRCAGAKVYKGAPSLPAAAAMRRVMRASARAPPAGPARQLQRRSPTAPGGRRELQAAAVSGNSPPCCAHSVPDLAACEERLLLAAIRLVHLPRGNI
jgi:hypothetical protein